MGAEKSKGHEQTSMNTSPVEEPELQGLSSGKHHKAVLSAYMEALEGKQLNSLKTNTPSIQRPSKARREREAAYIIFSSILDDDTNFDETTKLALFFELEAQRISQIQVEKPEDKEYPFILQSERQRLFYEQAWLCGEIERSILPEEIGHRIIRQHLFLVTGPRAVVDYFDYIGDDDEESSDEVDLESRY